ncbi:MAG: HPr family phosphocarrier protein [Gammaproteobacteria bacterium]|nr:HPr family phosphocarrier protein [Gammaproteobacteria bacterium]NIR98803.1 HPr family phosphocarrier protein [Gammaproteobacteria bacterium]NIT64513.1 HPr family phosphocarrier protein [Gammaproteobacteria bacterium]NIV21433.1 HPr family phosphocarrier protein [Gammaproteobacteria bacterium]NIX11303.1 HPr family phosphocarrier protein [Gammaproteobacteria bacterium]
MIKRELAIVNKLGLHARAAAKFVTLASSFESDIQLSRNDRQVNGKSIMGIMMLAASKGTTLALTVCGKDEQEAAEQLVRLVADGFGEQE